ncbi:hypothetical protein [Acetobacter sp.]|uniref:hypothetical protein n=1 Tax=Acetobacter sp. TaxID=440 RepID=UPI0039ECC8F4
MADTVTVCCRLPHGLRLRLTPEGDVARRAALSKAGTPDRSPTGYVKEVVINGANRAPNYHPKDNVMLGCVGRTQVEKSFWDAWLAQHKDSDLVKNHCVFAELTEAKADAKSSELSQEKTGFEPIDPAELKKKGIEAAEASA